MKNKLKFSFIFLLFACLIDCKKENINEKNSLLDIIAEPVGNNCSAGGFKIVTGIDNNNNNILDDSEIQNSSFICNGNDAKNSLVLIIPELDESICNTGGYKILSGLDVNSNNLLENGEIQDSSYICNGNNGIDGTNGLNSLMNVIPESPGESCSSGGYKINTGLDLNGNTQLDDNEIQITKYICNGNDGVSDKMIIINLLGSGYTTSSSWVLADIGILRDFDIDNYIDADSISFGTYCNTFNASNKCNIELYDLTNNKSIENTQIYSNIYNASVWTSTKINFISNLPKGKINLGVRIKSEIEGSGVSCSSGILSIYRK
jgi:hypothetical protein